MDQVKSLIKEHLEKNKFFDTLKAAVAKDPRLASLDRQAIIEKVKSEGILSDILQSIPVSKKQQVASGASMTAAEQQVVRTHTQEAKRMEGKMATSLTARIHGTTKT